MPPDALTVAWPELPPQGDVVEEDMLEVSAVGCVMVALVEAVQPPVAVTVTEYVPAVTPETFCVVAPLLHK